MTTRPGLKPHWISKFLTEPWELNDKGDLAFHDFTHDRPTKLTPSARLFRAKKRNRPRELENRLNTLIETPVSKARSDLLAPGQFTFEDRKTYRALVLLLMFQGSRTKAKDEGSDAPLLPFLEFSDGDFDLLVEGFMRGRQLVRLGTDPAHGLFYPSTGFFWIMTRDSSCPTGWTQGVAVPLSPTVAVVLLSESADWEWLIEQCASNYLQRLSLAQRSATRVVIPPQLFGTRSDALHDAIRLSRPEGAAYLATIQKLRADKIEECARAGTRLCRRDRLTDRFGEDDETPSP